MNTYLPNMTRSLFFIVQFVALLSLTTYGQVPTDLRFEHISGQQGLPESALYAYAIFQDREGFIWLGASGDGVCKYDGTSATRFVRDANDPVHSPQAGFVTDFQEDRMGRLWVTTLDGGWHYVDKRNGKTTAFHLDTTRHTQQIIPGNNSIGTVREGQPDVLWMTTLSGIVRFNPDTRAAKLYRYPLPVRGHYKFLHPDAEGIIWAIHWAGIYRLDPRTGVFQSFPLLLPGGVKPNPLSFYLDAAGIAWVGTYADGLFQMDTRKPGQFTAYNPQGLVNRTILHICEIEGGLWLATADGIQRIEPKTGQIITYRADPSLPGRIGMNIIHSLYQDRSKNLWVGTRYGLDRTSLVAKPFQSYQLLPTSISRDENLLFNILEDHTGTIWLGSFGKGLHRFDPKRNQVTPITVNRADSRRSTAYQRWPLCEDRAGNLWVGTDMDKSFCRLNRATGQFTCYACQFTVMTLKADSSGKLWIGGLGSELAFFDLSTGKLTRFKPDSSNTSKKPVSILVSHTGEVWTSLQELTRYTPKTGRLIRYGFADPASKKLVNFSFEVTTLYEDEAGIIWVGTVESGLVRLNPRTNAISYLTTRDGLPSNWVESIISDTKGTIWIGTHQGLCRYNPKTKTIRNFDQSDGLSSATFMREGVYRRHGRLMFGTLNGFVIFHPDSINEAIPVPPIYITGLKVLEKSQSVPTQTLELPYDQNFLSFDFVALYYDAPNKLRYAYKLDGLEKDWVIAGNRRFASYPALTSGAYVFRIKAAIGEGAWREASPVHFVIRPPWWRTVWFVSLATALILGSVFVGFRYRVAQIRQEETQKTEFTKKLSEMEMQALRAQMNPHFIFNSLNSINTFILKNEPDAASNYLTKFSRLIRLILQNSNSAVVTLQNELEALHLYLDMESLRFRNKFTFHIRVGSEVEPEDIEIPPLIIQPYVENAIWHGLLHKEAVGHLSIDLRVENDKLVCVIDDDGVGRRRAGELKSKSASKSKSMGMQITAHRIELMNELYGKQTTVDIIDLVDSFGEACGTRVVLTMSNVIDH